MDRKEGQSMLLVAEHVNKLHAIAQMSQHFFNNIFKLSLMPQAPKIKGEISWIGRILILRIFRYLYLLM